MKFLILFLIIMGIAWYFLRKKSPANREEEMVECIICGTFVSTKEALHKKGRTYCSNECKKRDTK